MTTRGLVLICEDDRTIADVERLYLTQAGFGTQIVADGNAALEAVRSARPVAVVLDIGLPGIDGTEVCRNLREAGDWTPVLFVTARDEEVDRLRGLHLGGDDYIVKPFSPRELVARVEAVLRRMDGTTTERSEYSVGKLTIDTSHRRAHAGGEEIALTTMEFDLLTQLVRNPDVVFSRDELLSRVWGYAAAGGTRTVDVHVAQLRAKIGESAHIRTVRGVGYAISAQAPDEAGNDGAKPAKRARAAKN